MKRYGSGPSPSADSRAERRAATRAQMFDDYVDGAVYVARSLRQMIRAGQRFAMVPRALAGPELGLIIANLDAPRVCGVVLEGAPFDVAWVCLARWSTDEPAHGLHHAWPDADQRLAAAAALVEQVDPIARIERRVAFALEGPSAHPLLAGMPSA